MKGLVAVALFSVSCVALPLGDEGVEDSVGESREVDEAHPNMPPCVAMSQKIHAVYYKACGAWSEFPIASVCYFQPDPHRCWKFDSHQNYDGLYCCCDPGLDESCDPFH